MAPPELTQQEEEDMLVPKLDVVEEAPQPMEELHTAASDVTTEESDQVDDPPIAKFVWRIENFSRLSAKRLFSDVFEAGEFKWRVLIFPKGNNVEHLSMYLDVADPILPNGWSRVADFRLTVVNQLNSKYTIRKEVKHKFHAGEKDWGFTTFMFLNELEDTSRGYLVNDTCVIEAEVIVHKELDNYSYDSKKETGLVGLKNQGATCYMNSLLQTLYHIPYFRKAVYHMPTNVNDMPSPSIPLALQCIFYKLQYNDDSVSTKELTKSFGWDTYDGYLQHDVQELNRVLCEKLEEKMKGTVVEGAIQQLFEGHLMNYIECVNMDYKSRRRESFYDLQLDVKGCCDVYASFDKYVQVEHLDGDNKYRAEQHGLQDAKKGVLFMDFPPVLQLHLKRFEYDYVQDIMVKINDRYEFPLQLDLDREDGRYLSPDADRGVRNLYTLHSVLVHSGGVQSGHYYVFIRPTLYSQWYKFDDERVTKEDMDKSSEELYGGEGHTNTGFHNNLFKFANHSSAYMLVYIRESDKDKIMCNVDQADIAEHIKEKLKREHEEEEQREKEKSEAHHYTVVKVACDDDLAYQIGKDVFFDLVDFEKVRSFRIQKQMKFNVFKEEVAKGIGRPVEFLRFWLWAERQNLTYRPTRPVTLSEEAQPVGYLMEIQSGDLKLFLEMDLGPNSEHIPLHIKEKDDMLLFFKLYDPENEELRYAGRLLVKSNGRPTDILARLNEMAGYAPDEEIELFEEVKFTPVMCCRIDKRATFKSCQLENGDIVCYQKSPSAESCHRLPDVHSFLQYRHNLQVIHFRSPDKPKDDKFCLQLSKLATYDEVVEKVARELMLDDSSRIRLTSHSIYSQQPRSHPVKYRGANKLLDMLVDNNQISDILYYEVLDIPLPELQGLRTLRVAFYHASNNDMEIHNIRLAKESTFGDLLDNLRMKVQLSQQNAELRLLEVLAHRIYKVFSASEKIEIITDNNWMLRAEEITEEEKNLGPSDCLIHVYHFTREVTQQQVIRNFGMPFLTVIHEDEMLADVKIRIQKKLQIVDEEFSKWRFAVVSQGKAEYLEDSDSLFTRFQGMQKNGGYVTDPYLGLEHSDNALKRSAVANQYRPPYEKAVKIYN